MPNRSGIRSRNKLILLHIHLHRIRNKRKKPQLCNCRHRQQQQQQHHCCYCCCCCHSHQYSIGSRQKHKNSIVPGLFERCNGTNRTKEEGRLLASSSSPAPRLVSAVLVYHAFHFPSAKFCIALVGVEQPRVAVREAPVVSHTRAKIAFDRSCFFLLRTFRCGEYHRDMRRYH